MLKQTFTRRALSMIELLAVVAVLSIVVKLVLPRLTGGSASAKSAACQTIKGDIEIQVELWRHNTGSLPTANLSGIGADPNYFPTGVPLCPLNGTAYTINSSGRVVGHNH